jgi:hypothetical protein
LLQPWGISLSNLRQIIDERLARGEIALEEHQALVVALQAGQAPDHQAELESTPETLDAPAAPPPLPTPAPQTEAVEPTTAAQEHKPKQPIWKNPFAIGAALGVVLIGFLANNNQGTVRINNARMTGIIFATVSGTVINDGPKGDVWVWVVQEGKNLCPRRTYMAASSSERFSYRCESGNPWLDGSIRGSKNPPKDVESSNLGL